MHSTEEELIRKYTPLVKHYVNKFQPRDKSERDDLMQIGYIGLLKAIRNFDATRSNSIATLAHECIKNILLNNLKLENRYNVGYSNQENLELHLQKNKPNLEEYLPKLASLEYNIIQMLKQKYTKKEIIRLLNLDKFKFNQILQSIYKKVKRANA